MINSIIKGLKEAFISVFPVIVIVLLLCPFIDISLNEIFLFLFSSFILMFGLSLFTSGASSSMMLIGEKVGKSIIKTKNLFLILLVVFITGVIITIAEPDLKVLASQLSISNTLMIMTVAFGIGIFLFFGALRSFFNLNLSRMLVIFYSLVFILVCFVSKENIAFAFDAGGVTTGPVSAPFIMALSAGLCFNKASKLQRENTFGLIGLCSVGPIISVLLLSMIYNIEGIYEYNAIDLNLPAVEIFSKQFIICFKEVVIAVFPIFILFVIFKLVSKEFDKDDSIKIFIGLVLTVLGLSIFLASVNTGFMNMGYKIGIEFGSSIFKYLLIPIGMILGFFIVKAEPAVKILNEKIEEVTSGSITREMMQKALSVGVSLAIGCAMIKVLTNVSILYFIVPVYFTSLVLSFFVPKIFTAIGADCGGVVAGPLTVTFLLPLSIGVSTVLGSSLNNAFGLVALIAMTPLLTVQILGLVYKIKTDKHYKEKDIDESIITYDWRNNHE